MRIALWRSTAVGGRKHAPRLGRSPACFRWCKRRHAVPESSGREPARCRQRGGLANFPLDKALQRGGEWRPRRYARRHFPPSGSGGSSACRTTPGSWRLWREYREALVIKFPTALFNRNALPDTMTWHQSGRKALRPLQQVTVHGQSPLGHSVQPPLQLSDFILAMFTAFSIKIQIRHLSSNAADEDDRPSNTA